jgi:hypothetical protein
VSAYSNMLWSPEELGVFGPASPLILPASTSPKSRAKQSAPGKGNNGEWLAAAAIKHFSPDWCGPCFIAFMESNGPYDLHCVSSVDPSFQFRVECKSTEVLRGGAFQTCKHDRQYGEGGIVQEGFVLYDEGDADMMAFAAVDLFCVNFMPVVELTKRGMSIGAGQFTREIMRYSLARSLDVVRRRRQKEAA